MQFTITKKYQSTIFLECPEKYDFAMCNFGEHFLSCPVAQKFVKRTKSAQTIKN